MKTTIFLIFGMILINLALASAIDVQINIADEFSSGEASFSYDILSNAPADIQYASICKCENAPVAPLRIYNKSLAAEGGLSGKQVCFSNAEELEPQQCSALVIVSENGQEKTWEKNFSIKTLHSFTLELKFCKDALCNEKMSIFSTGEVVYLDYDSNVKYNRPGMKSYEKLSVNAQIYSPDGKTQAVALPYKLVTEHAGEYVIEASATKQGYRDKTAEGTFNIISKVSNVEIVDVCDSNGICEGQESGVNCPQDCPKTKEQINEKEEIRKDTEKVVEQMQQKTAEKSVCSTNGVCEGKETIQNCPSDCKSVLPAKTPHDASKAFPKSALAFVLVILFFSVAISFANRKRS